MCGGVGGGGGGGWLNGERGVIIYVCNYQFNCPGVRVHKVSVEASCHFKHYL